jgi:hypothetical protein
VPDDREVDVVDRVVGVQVRDQQRAAVTPNPATAAAPAAVPLARRRVLRVAHKREDEKRRAPHDRGDRMAAERTGGNTGGIGIGGILVIIGIVLMIVWSFWIGLIILLIGLIAFGGFARGKWY